MAHEEIEVRGKYVDDLPEELRDAFVVNEIWREMCVWPGIEGSLYHDYGSRFGPHAVRALARIGATGHAEVLGELNNVFGPSGIPNTWDEACEVLTEENYHMLEAFDEKWHQLPDLDCLLIKWDWNRRIQGS